MNARKVNLDGVSINNGSRKSNRLNLISEVINKIRECRAVLFSIELLARVSVASRRKIF